MNITMKLEAEVRGMVWVECDECHGTGSLPTSDGVGHMWCWKCEHGEGGWAVWPAPEAT